MALRGFLTAVCGPLLIGLAACGQHEPTAWTTEPSRTPSETAAEAGYLAPPRVTEAERRPDGALELEGAAAPGARVRLAQPSGAALFTSADEEGLWRLTVPKGAEVRLFGLSMTAQDRTVQSDGYLMLTAEGHAAQLRAGAGAAPLADPSRTPRILAVDYDSDGGAVVTGVARPRTTLTLRVDQAPRGEAHADDNGRFTISLTEPLGAGVHDVEVAGEGGADEITVDAARPGGIGPGPFEGRRTPYGWRVDWITPGGGAQTTQIFDREGTGA